MDFLLLVSYIFVGFLVLTSLSREVRMAKTWNLSVWVHSWLFIYYILIPVIHLITAKQDGLHIGFWENIEVKHNSYVTYKTLLGFLVFFVSYGLALSFKFKPMQVERKVLTFNHFDVPYLKLFTFLLFLVAIFSVWYYARALGGFVEAFKISPYLNSPYFGDKYTSLYSGIHTMFKRFIAFSIYPILFMGFYKYRSTWFTIVLLSIVIYVYYVFLERQRQLTIILFLIPILGYQVYHKKFINARFLIGAITLVFLLPIITFMSKAFIYNQSEYEAVTGWFTLGKYVKEFNFPQISLYLAQETEYPKFILNDFYQGIFGNYLPSSFYNGMVVNELNSSVFEGQVSRSVPPGIVANSFYHLGWFGLVFWGALMGFIVNLIDVLFKSLILYDRRYSYAFIYTYLSFFALIRTGVMGFSLYRPFFVFFILIVVFSHVFTSDRKDPLLTT